MPKKEPHQPAKIKGYFTRERGILGKTPLEMARLLGYPQWRMAQGVKVYALSRLPRNEEFEIRGYTYWPGGNPRLEPGEKRVPLWSEKHADIDKQWMRAPEIRVKDNVRGSWTLAGMDRLIKIQPNTLDDGVYPSGAGLEQWELVQPVDALLIWVLAPDERYQPYGSPRYR